MLPHALLTVALLALSTPALAAPACTPSPIGSHGSLAITPALLETIMPASASCAGRGAECTNSTVAAPLLAASFDTYGLATKQEQAGVLALIAYESVELNYRNNSVAVNVAKGQGTANQQMGTFNLNYANSFPELKRLNLSLGTVLSQVTKDSYNFGTGAWYYKLQPTRECSGARLAALNDTKTAWEWFSQSYLLECVGVNASAQTGRVDYWNNAMEAFGFTNDTTMGSKWEVTKSGL